MKEMLNKYPRPRFQHFLWNCKSISWRCTSFLPITALSPRSMVGFKAAVRAINTQRTLTRSYTINSKSTSPWKYGSFTSQPQSTTVAANKRNFTCPVPGCKILYRTFSRPRDLVRHYTIRKAPNSLLVRWYSLLTYLKDYIYDKFYRYYS